jgi:hypothetical protein
MRKEDIEWGVHGLDEEDKANGTKRRIEISGNTYAVDEKTACITHAILLLIDSLNDKNFR